MQFFSTGLPGTYGWDNFLYSSEVMSLSRSLIPDSFDLAGKEHTSLDLAKGACPVIQKLFLV